MSRTIDLSAIRSLPIESVAERLGLRVERHRCLCPYHEDSNPSLSFLVSKNTFRCFSCGAHGGVVDLAMRVLGKGFREACEWLANEHNIIIEQWKPAEQKPVHPFEPGKYMKYFDRPFINQMAGNFLYDERHLHPNVVGWCRLTSWREWLQIPYFDVNGNLIGVQWRNLGHDGPRFRFPCGSQCHIYNLPILRYLNNGDELYIAEGCSDCWSLMSSGHKAIAIPSATLLNPDDMRKLSNINSRLSIKWGMYPDNDQPGENLFNQLKAVVPLTRHQLPSDCKDYSVYYLKYLWK